MRREIFEKHRGLIRAVFRKMAIDESESPMVPIGTIGKPASNQQPTSMPSYYYIFAGRPNVLQRKWDFGKFSQKSPMASHFHCRWLMRAAARNWIMTESWTWCARFHGLTMISLVGSGW